MSSGQSSQRRKAPVQEPRAPLFEVQEKPLRKAPRPIERAIDPLDELPDIGPRAVRRNAPTRRAPEPIEPPPPAQERTPPAQQRAASQRQDTFHRYAANRRPVYEPDPAWDAPVVMVRGRPWLLLVVALVCVAIIWMYSAESRIVISTYNGLGLGSAASNDAGKLFASPDTPAGEHSIIGEPTITAAAVDTILEQYGSPAAGTGQAWIAIGRRYGIDPAYALAFFIHESSAGTNPGWAGLKPNGASTHNIGNIICAGYATCYGRFRDYATWEEGIEDWYKLISVEYIGGRRAHTVEAIIPIYAPSSDNNNVPGYIGAVVKMVNQWRQGVLR